MGCKITNRSPYNMSKFEEVVSDFYPYVQKRLGFDKHVAIDLVSDPENAKDPFGKTAYYDPNEMKITVFVDKRHFKDILRSLSHELVHHSQNCRGEFDKKINTGEGYAQKDPHMRRMEAEAYLLGNGFLVRDFEDSYLKENIIMEESKIREAIKQALEIALEESKGEKKPDGDGDGAPPWADKDDSDPEVQEEAVEEGHGTDPLADEQLEEETGHDHPGMTCEEAHPDMDHDTAVAAKATKGSVQNPHERMAGAPHLEENNLNESFGDKKSRLLFEELTSKWCK